MAIVVTGATGQLGAQVVQDLLGLGVHGRGIVAAGRDAARLSAVARHGVHSARIDYEAPESLDAAFGRGDTVLFVSGSAPGRRMTQHANVVEAARRAGVGRLVYTSIAHADTVDTVLTPDHRATEALIRDSGVPFTFLRNNLYAETQVPAVLEAAEHNLILNGWGGGRIAGASRVDYAAGAAVVLAGEGHDGAVYEFAAETAFSGEDLAAAASELLGKTVLWQTRTGDESEIQLALAGVPEAARRFRIGLDLDIQHDRFAAVSSVLSGLIGRPTTPLVDALRAALPKHLPTAPSTTTTPQHP
jgi:NAD(P)H dehydrogenase (quinone)